MHAMLHGTPGVTLYIFVVVLEGTPDFAERMWMAQAFGQRVFYFLF